MNRASPLDGAIDVVIELIEKGLSYSDIAYKLKSELDVSTSERSLRRAVKRWGIRKDQPKAEKAGSRISGDEADVVSGLEADLDLNDTDALLRERGLDPDDWNVESVTVNEWQAVTGEMLKQLKVHLKRKKLMDMVVPARVSLNPPRPWIPQLTSISPELVVFASDQHAPYHEPELHKHFCDFLAAYQPDRIVLVGDTMDLSTISRHPAEPEWAPSVQECVDSAGQILLDIREAAPQAQIIKLPGNHDERLRRAIIDRLGEFYGLKPAQIESFPELRPGYDPVYLLRLDELRIEYVRPQGKWDQGQYMVSPYLAARHGWIARKGSGSSALATLDHLGHSIVVGHTHRQSLVHQTKHNLQNTTYTKAAAEIGCMCRIENGLGYTPAPDWQQGFATASLWDDGKFHLDLATFIDNHLYWRSDRF